MKQSRPCVWCLEGESILIGTSHRHDEPVYECQLHGCRMAIHEENERVRAYYPIGREEICMLPNGG